MTGEVVDVSCYLQLGKRGEAHVACGTKCITNGQPIGLLDAKDNLYLLFAEEHHPRRDGEVELKTVFLPWLAKTVTVTGVAVEARLSWLVRPGRRAGRRAEGAGDEVGSLSPGAGEAWRDAAKFSVTT